MEAFVLHTGFAVPLDRANVDTDQIIPKQYLKSIKRTGFGDYLFDSWRFLDSGEIGMTPNERRINRDFVLNEAKYQGASILLARDNFACGSSREHAVWALQEYGFKVVIAPSFADIFYTNCFKNGLLPVSLSEQEIDALFLYAMQGNRIEVDLEKQRVSVEDQSEFYTFEIAENLKKKMLSGIDDIALTLSQSELIERFEAMHRENQPWLFRE